MEYRPREFWDQRLSEQFDLRGTGETGLSLAYNRACYQLRGEVLTRALAEHGFDPAGRTVLDVGCGSGFFTAYYLSRGARLTGVDLSSVSIERLRQRHPEARFIQSDVSDLAIGERFDLVNAFDVLYHIVDDAAWERAVRHLCDAVAPGGLLLLTDGFPGRVSSVAAAHNRMRPFASYEPRLRERGMGEFRRYPTHVLLNRDLGTFRRVNRFPGLLLGLDRMLLTLGFARGPGWNHLLVARRRS